MNGERYTGPPASSFPMKLMAILSGNRFHDIVAWLPHGRGFMIYKKERFASEVLPLYFPRESKFASFTRRLSRWGFRRIRSGPEIGVYHHPLFRRGNYEVCLQMHCVSKTPKDDLNDPNFYTEDDNNLYLNDDPSQAIRQVYGIEGKKPKQELKKNDATAGKENASASTGLVNPTYTAAPFNHASQMSGFPVDTTGGYYPMAPAQQTQFAQMGGMGMVLPQQQQLGGVPPTAYYNGAGLPGHQFMQLAPQLVQPAVYVQQPPQYFQPTVGLQPLAAPLSSDIMQHNPYGLTYADPRLNRVAAMGNTNMVLGAPTATAASTPLMQSPQPLAQALNLTPTSRDRLFSLSNNANQASTNKRARNLEEISGPLSDTGADSPKKQRGN